MTPGHGDTAREPVPVYPYPPERRGLQTREASGNRIVGIGRRMGDLGPRTGISEIMAHGVGVQKRKLQVPSRGPRPTAGTGYSQPPPVPAYPTRCRLRHTSRVCTREKRTLVLFPWFSSRHSFWAFNVTRSLSNDNPVLEPNLWLRSRHNGPVPESNR